MLRLLGGSSEVHMRSLRLCLFLGQLPSFRELLSWAVDSVLKSKGFILPMKVRIVKAMVFPVVTYRCES